MSMKIPVGGVFASVYYQFEDAFQVYEPTNTVNSTLDPYGTQTYLGIDKILGQGVKITSWTEKNNVQLVRGMNNVEAATSYDGQYEGELGLEFEATGDLAWMEALMGKMSYSVTYGNKVKEYTKKGIPKTLTFLIVVKNDQDDETAGDVFVIKGGIITTASIGIEGSNAPLHVSITVPYAKEVPYDGTSLPDFYNSQENVFNAGQATAYFWNPTADPTGLSSFNSLETVVDNFSMEISHGADMIRGIGSRLARDKYYKYLEYTIKLKSYYKDKERLLQKFYGCSDGPSPNCQVAPMKKVLLVVQNCSNCGENYRRYEFEFNNVKLNTRDSTIDVEDAITETYEMKPYNAVIRAWNGQSPAQEFNVAPQHIKQGELVIMSGANLPRSSTVSIAMGSKTWSVPVNCTGTFELRVVADTTNFTLGNQTITMTPTEGDAIARTVYVTAQGTYGVPSIVVCPAHFNTGTETVSGVFVKGVNFAPVASTTTMTLTITSGTGVTKHTEDLSALVDASGNFTSSTFSLDIDGTSTGQIMPVTVVQEVSGEGTYTVSTNLYVTNLAVTNVSSGVNRIVATGMKPYERALLYIDGVYKGASAADNAGQVTYLSVPTGTGSKLAQVKQNVILADGTGQLVASKTVSFS